jgi:hypothetical protein
VPLDEVLIKLHPEGFHEEFEADGINVGAGGLSMRASVLPDVGSTLRCQLDNPAGGEAIELIGRVVWAHENGPHVGEFGIRFTHLSEQDQVRIEALIQRWGRATAKAPVVRLQLDGVGSSIVAEVHAEDERALSVEQPLPFLAIGNPILNESTGRRGHLEAVELKMDEATPKLVLSIGYESLAPGDDESEEQVDRDTLPDEAPSGVRIRTSDSEERLQDTPRIVRYDPETDDVPAQTLAARLRGYVGSAVEQTVSAFGAMRGALTERLLPWTKAQIGEAVGLVSRFVAALRSRLDDKPRRRQIPRSRAARAHMKNTRRQGRRYLVVLVMAVAIVAAGWGIYLWAASGTDAVAETETGAEIGAETGSAAETETETETESESESESETAAETAAESAAASATEGDAAAPLPPEPVRGAAFGAQTVAGGERYVLRMSNPVVEMDGIVEDDGFSVTIPGSLSLSRAGPIATAHPDVEHASILNRGDFSELTLRFVAGRHPAYRVEARGPAVEITIAR